MDLGLGGKTVMISGATRGIGRAIAAIFAQEGARLSICSRNPDDLGRVAAELSMQYGVAVFPYTADMKAPDSATQWVDATVEHFGAIDIVINNAGSPPPGRFLELSDQAWSDAFASKPFGYFRLARAALGHLIASHGALVNVIGIAGHQPLPQFMIGNVGDAALINFTKALAGDVAKHGVRINAVSPGFVRTERWSQMVVGAGRMLGADGSEAEQVLLSTMPFGRPAEMSEVARVVAFLGSEAASYVTGTTVLVDGGATRSVSF